MATPTEIAVLLDCILTMLPNIAHSKLRHDADHWLQVSTSNLFYDFVFIAYFTWRSSRMIDRHNYDEDNISNV